MVKERHNFVYGNPEEDIPGCLNNGISEKVANKIYDEMMDFAKYAFNKSHAAAYAVVSYQTAYLKYYYAAEFMAAMLTSVMNVNTKVAEYIYACKEMKIEILPPDINEGVSGFSVSNDSIRYGLSAIKNVGKGLIDNIIIERDKRGKFKDLEDFISRTTELGVNKRAIENFIKAGAFDSFGATRKQMMMVYLNIVDSVNQSKKDSMAGQVTFFDIADENDKDNYKIQMPNVGEYDEGQKLEFEKEVMGIYVSSHPLNSVEQKWRKHITNTCADFMVTEDEEMSQEPKVKDKSKVVVGGIINAVTKKFTKNGDQMAFLTVEDLLGTVEVVVFARVLAKNRAYIEEGKKVFVFGRASVESNSTAKVLATSIVPFEEMGMDLWLAFRDMEEYETKSKEVVDYLLLHKGNDHIKVYIAKEKMVKNLAFKVDASEEVLSTLREMLGEGMVILK